MQPVRYRVIPALSAAVLFSQPVAAQTACKTPSPECVVVGEWNISVGLGLGRRSNPVQDNSDIPLVVVPQISYYGQRFFLENLELGFTLYESDAHSLSLIAAPGYDRVFFYRNDLQNILANVSLSTLTADVYSVPIEVPVRTRHTTYMVGPEWTFNSGPVIGQVNALYEVTGRHDGYEVRAALAAPIIQSRDSLVFSTGVTWKSDRLVNYYYGVEPLYEPGSALNPFVKLAYTRPLSSRWTLGASVHYEVLDNAIADSPIIIEGQVMTVFAGFMYKLL
jgi:outer membrane protein